MANTGPQAGFGFGGSTNNFLGEFISLVALQAAHPTASAGNYAHINAGDGQDVQEYIWDTDDTRWVLGTAVTGVASVNGDAGPVVVLGTGDISDAGDANKYVTSGEKAAAGSVAGLTDNAIPVATATGLEDGPQTYTAADNMIRSSAALQLPGGGALRFDNNDLSSGGTVSGGASGVRFTNLTDATTGYLVNVPFSEAGSSTPFYDNFGAGFDLPSAADKSDTRDAAFDFINPLPGIVTQYTVSRPAGSDPLTNCNFIIWLEGYNTGVPLFDFKESNPGGTGFDLVAGENTVVSPVPIGFPANIDPTAPSNEQVRLYSHVVDSTGALIQLEGQEITIPASPDPRAEQQWLPYLERHVHFSSKVELQDAVEHPVTLRRDMPSLEDSLALANASLNENSALWIVANNQLVDSNRSDAMIYALQSGFFDLDGNEISTTPVAANTIQLRGGTTVRIFGQNDFRVVNSPVLEGDIEDNPRSIVIDLTADYTSQASDFVNVDHVFYRFDNSGQVDLTIPVSIVPENALISVKEIGQGGPSHRVLVSTTGGTIDGQVDHLLNQEEAFTLHKGASTNLDIISDYEFSNTNNNFVTSGGFSGNLLTLNRSGLSSVPIGLALNDINNSVSGLPLFHGLNLSAQPATRQTIDLGSLSLDWSALSGGRIGVKIYFATQSVGGFLPDFRTLTLNYGLGALVLNFNLNGINPDLETVITTTIPASDYSAILNTNPVGTLTVDVRGFRWVGNIQFREMYNRETSLIHDDIESIAEVVASQGLQPVQDESDANAIKIENNRQAINQLAQMIDTLSDLIPGSTLSWLINEVNIVDVATPVFVPTPYNTTLSSDNTQAIFVDDGQQNVSNVLQSTAMQSTQTRGQLMIEIMQPYSAGDNIIRANDGGGNTQVVLKRVNNSLMAVKFVPAHGGGSRVITHTPTPSNLVAHDWYDVAGHTPSLAAESNELFFTGDLPSTPVTLNIRYRHFANGAPGPIISATLANVGGSSDTEYQADLSLPDGELFHIIIQWRVSDRRIVYEAIPRANNTNFFIFDTQVSLNWTETVTEPSTPETTEDIRIGPSSDNTPPLALFAPSVARSDGNAATLVITGVEGSIDTGYAYNDLFTSTDTGGLEALATPLTNGWYEWEKFTPSASLVSQFAARIGQPYFGWFAQEFNHNTVAQLGTQVQVKDSDDHDVLAGQESVIQAPNGTHWRVSVDNAGNLITTQEV